MIQLTTTKEQSLSSGLKVLIHGNSGSGKTFLCSTINEPTVIISAEAGLLSLRHVDIPVITVNNMEDVQEAYSFISGKEGDRFSWVCLDSISEIAEQVLSCELKQTRDPRAAYGELSTQMMDLLRAFRDLPGKSVYMSAKQRRVEDDDGKTSYAPLMPGKQLGQQIPYLFDLVFALRVEKDADGNPTRWLQTSADTKYTAKDRSGALDLYEPADLSAIAAKIRG